MKKSIFKTLSLAMMIAPLVGCATGGGPEGFGQSSNTNQGDGATSNAGGNSDNDGDVEISIPDNVRTIKYLVSIESKAYTTALKKIINDFNAIYIPKGYAIKTETPGGDYYESLSTMIASNKQPDIFMMEYGSFNAFQDRMLDVSPYLAKSTALKATDLWDLNDYYKVNGKLKAIIKDFSPDFMLIYNKTLLNKWNTEHPTQQYHLDRETPVTWEYFYEMTSALQREGGVQYGTSLAFEGVKHLHELVQSNGANMYKNNDTEVNITDSNVRKSFAFFISMQKDNVTHDGTDTAPEIQPYGTIQALHASKKAPASYTSGSTTSEQELFKQQRCFCIFNGLYAFPFYDFYSLDFEWDVAPHPLMNVTSTTKPFGTTSAMVSHGISSKTKYPDVAWAFVEYYQTKGLEELAKIAYNIPGNKTVAASDNFLKNSNAKTQDMVNYFYNFVNSGYCVPTKYNDNIDYGPLSTCYQTAWNKYYKANSTQTFNDLLNEVNKLIKNQ